ncbi:MAG: DUF433 domain-containing protein [Chloroflexia bacterium]|nr:DUF433 domain-containing protein [Chloroflexia bacterium]
MATTAKTKQTPFGERIVSDPNVDDGAPLVKGTHVPVERVLAQLAAKPDLDDVLALYPELSVEDMQAVFTYARAAVQAQVRSGQPMSPPAPDDIWATYDPEKALQALDRLAESMRDVDFDKLRADIRAGRGHEPHEQPD